MERALSFALPQSIRFLNPCKKLQKNELIAEGLADSSGSCRPALAGGTTSEEPQQLTEAMKSADSPKSGIAISG